jgi:hypothetical protein
MPLIVAAYLALLAAASAGIAVQDRAIHQHPRDVYASHVYDCPTCGSPAVTLCPQGERLRKAARDADGFRDPALDR